MTNKGIPSYDDKLREVNARLNRLLEELRKNGAIKHGQYIWVRDGVRRARR